LDEDVLEKTKPGLITNIPEAVDAVLGGMHTAILTQVGQVFTFGYLNNGTLGRYVCREEGGNIVVLGRKEIINQRVNF